MGRKPDFFIVGAAKSGTSSLYNYLIQHRSIFMPKTKEPHFFGSGRSLTEGYALEEYTRLFETIPEDIRVGEASTSYLYLASAAQEIKRFRPDAKIVMVLRNPVDRAYSQYWNHVRDGRESLSFEEALKAEPERIRHGYRFYRDLPSSHYLEAGRYSEQVERYFKLFGRESIRVYLFEDLLRDAHGVCCSAFSFLDVDPSWPITVGRIYNSSGPPRSTLLSKLIYRPTFVKEALKGMFPTPWMRNAKEWVAGINTRSIPEMNPETRTALKQHFREDIICLEETIKRDMRQWLR